ncbi:MAG: DUF3164 family protein, partial [Methyloversatilis sp.]
RDELVREKVAAAKALSAMLAEFKAKAFADVGVFLEMSAEEYGVKLGGNKGNVTLITFDGRFKVVRQVREALVFDERLQAAKALIDECLQEWTTGSRDEIKALINDAFQVNKEGEDQHEPRARPEAPRHQGREVGPGDAGDIGQRAGRRLAALHPHLRTGGRHGPVSADFS